MENTKKIIKCQTLLVTSWREYVAGFNKFVLIYAYGLMGFIPLVVLILLSMFFGWTGLWTKLPLAVQLSFGFIWLLGLIASFISIIYFVTRAKIACLLLIKNNYSNALENFKAASKYFWGMLGVSLLMIVVVLAWGLLFIIPALIFLIYYAFAAYILVVEDKRSFSAMERSYDLVHGYWWAVCGRILLLVTIVSLVFSVLALPLRFLNEGSWPFIIYNLIINIIIIATSPYFIVYAYKIYTSLLEKNK